MGIQDRDYYRDESGSLFHAWSRHGAWLWIIIITTTVFFIQCLSGHPSESELVKVGAYTPMKVLQGEVWRLLTPMLLHANFFHLLFNMLIVWWAGRSLEELYGKLEFVAFYVCAGLFAQTVYFIVYLLGFADPRTLTLGASGAVVALLILFAFRFPRQKVLLFFVIPMPIWLLGVLLVVWDALGAIGVGKNRTAYVVHLGGALFGCLYYQIGIRISVLFSNFTQRDRRVVPHLRVVTPEPDDTPESVAAVVGSQSQSRSRENQDENLETEVDQVLEKVSKYGQESLTPEEREILFKASEFYKKRRK
jgi:membrane associated rhomboid family serine protease